jgi:hypothetical protein
MAPTLNRFVRRRLTGLALLAVAGGAAWTLERHYAHTLRFTGIGTGLALFATCLALAFFNARKKLPFLPLLTASSWTQFHIYAGWFAVVLFLLHAGVQRPNGIFETSLAVVFWLVAGSGAFGLVISRVYPARLTLHGENVIYARIPAMRVRLRQEVEALVWKSVEETQSFTLAEFYTTQLADYFARPQHLFQHLVKSEAPLQKILDDVRLLPRYMVDKERAILAEVTECIRAKDNLDFQLACQGLLKYWLFVHIPLTFSLLILGVIHGLLAYSFVGGLH